MAKLLNRRCWLVLGLLAIIDSVPLQGQSVEAEWNYIRRIANAYDQTTIESRNLNSIFFSHVFRGITEIAYENRVRNLGGRTVGWAGELTRASLRRAASDIQTRPNYWLGADWDAEGLRCHQQQTPSPLQTIGQGLLDPDNVPAMYLEIIEGVTIICQGARMGWAHFRDHLFPAFEYHFGVAVRQGMQATTPSDRVRATVARLRPLCAEHDAFLNNAVVPAFQLDDELNTGLYLAGLVSEYSARATRRVIILARLNDARDAGLITSEQMVIILNLSDCTGKFW